MKIGLILSEKFVNYEICQFIKSKWSLILALPPDHSKQI